MSIHDGHRQRLKERFLRDGLDGFTEIQILELLLFYAIPLKDTNPIAHNLLDKFGSLSRVLDAPVEKLTEVEGIKEHAATLIKLSKAIGRSYDISRSREKKILKSIDECGEYLASYFKDRKNETVFLLCLDAKMQVMGCVEIGEGSVNYASVPVRRVVEMALDLGATSVVVAHNHPSGIALPSGDDIQTTRRMAAAFSAVEIIMIDHLIFAGDEDRDYVSLAQSGYCFDDCLAL